MLPAENILKVLTEENKKGYQDYNDDYDFGDVLESLQNTYTPDRKIMCSDGLERDLSFNK